jgi:hypothetical protein
MRCAGSFVLAACVCALVGEVRGDAFEEAQKLVKEAEEQARDKKYDEAVATVHKALQLLPRDDRVLMVASEIERRASRYADGVEHALAAVKINDKVPLYLGLVAANAYGNQDPDLALEYCRKVLALGADKAGAALYKDMQLYEDRLVKKTYTITWNLDPQKGAFNGDSMPVALPKGDLSWQTVAVQVQGARSHRVVRGEVNDLLYVAPAGNTPFQVVTKVTVQPVSYKAKLEKARGGPLPREGVAFLGAGEFFDPAAPKLRKLGSELKGKTGVETVRNVMTWMHKNVTYKLQDKSIVKIDFKNVDEIIERGHAECKGFTMLFAALCRAAGVPARPIWGVHFLPREQGGFVSHNWDEVYLAGIGWVPVDPQKPETFGFLPTTHVRVLMDLRKSDKSQELLPLYNLLYMNGEKLQYEESRADKTPGAR